MASNLEFNVVALDRASQTFIRMSEQIERMSNRLEQLDGQTATVTANVRDNASGPLRRIAEQLGLIDGKEANVRVKVDKTMTDTINQVALLGRSLGALTTPVALAGAVTLLASIT